MSQEECSLLRRCEYFCLSAQHFFPISYYVDPDPFSEYESGSTKLLKTDPIWIRIDCTVLKIKLWTSNLFSSGSHAAPQWAPAGVSRLREILPQQEISPPVRRPSDLHFYSWQLSCVLPRWNVIFFFAHLQHNKLVPGNTFTCLNQLKRIAALSYIIR